MRLRQKAALFFVIFVASLVAILLSNTGLTQGKSEWMDA